MKFFMPNKPTKWGFKIHCLVDENTNYLYNLILDPGKDYKYFIQNEYKEKLTESIVLNLLKDLENPEEKYILIVGILLFHFVKN